MGGVPLWKSCSSWSRQCKENEEEGELFFFSPEANQVGCEDLLEKGVHDKIRYTDCTGCGWDRCCGHIHRLSERQRQWEKLMCPTYRSWARKKQRAGRLKWCQILEASEPCWVLSFFLLFIFSALHPANQLLGVRFIICLWNANSLCSFVALFFSICDSFMNSLQFGWMGRDGAIKTTLSLFPEVHTGGLGGHATLISLAPALWHRLTRRSPFICRVFI